MTDKLTMAVNTALQLAVNTQASQISMARQSLLNHGMGMDTKRQSAWCEYGYKADLTFRDLYNAYRRGGLAFSAVNKLVGKCFSSYPMVIEGSEKNEAGKETPWERSVNKTLTSRFWHAFAEADRRRLVGRYSGILIHFKDSKRWNEPVDRSGRAIEKFTVAWANCLIPKEYDSDVNSETYGQPTMWQYTATLPNGGKKLFDVHPDRVFILGDYTLDAIGYLEPGYNNLVNIEKVEGGSGESFLKNAARQLSVNFDKEIDFASLAAMYGVSVDELQGKYDEAAKELNRGNDTIMVTQGATTTPMVSDVPDPTPTYDINVQSFAASVDMPSRILVGNQQAERSSTEDNKYWNGRCQSRREIELNEEIEDFIEQKVIGLGVVKSVSEFTVMWDDLNEATQSEKLANMKLAAEIVDMLNSSGKPLLNDDQLLNIGGFEAKENKVPLGESLDDDLEDDENGEA
ncbi:portal protein [Vibrio phage NF]|uniref:Anti-CBASS protein Acb1-like N-terminal domain-containing protein n=1 Tax=Vibrio phage NF TaxID=2686202 RepID=A0A6B9J1S0_9CAUD|nr:portal protein [Vibrio phage NF]QGZ13226.1 hypothetical protein [Vibrio phage NF]